MKEWKIVRLKDIGYTYTGLSNKTAKDFGYGKNFIPYLNIFENSRIDLQFVHNVKVDKGENQNRVKFGDIFFTTSSETPDEVGMASVLLDEVGELYLNSFCFGFRLYDYSILLPEYARFYFRGPVFRRKMNYLAQGSTRYNLSKKALLESKLELPPIKEQRKISYGLDVLERLIKKTEQLIEKYKKVKEGMMQDLFTRGIDENGNLRPSYDQAPHLYKETELGMIPKEWEIISLGELGEIVTGSTPSTYRSEFYNGNYMFISPFDMNDNTIFVNSTDKSITFLGLEQTRIVPAKSICVTCIGSTIGKIAITSERCATNQQINSLIPYNLDIYKLLYYLMLHYLKKQLDIEAGLQAVPIVNKSKFAKLKIPLPKSDFEKSYCIEVLNSVDNRIQKENKYLNKLQKLKQGLMQDLLTGKVRVKV